MESRFVPELKDDLEVMNLMDLNPIQSTISNTPITPVNFNNWLEFDFSPFIGPLLFVGTIILFFYVSKSIPSNSSIDNVSSNVNLDLLSKTNNISNDVSRNSSEVVSSAMDGFSSEVPCALNPVISKVLEEPVILNEPILLLMKKVKFQMTHFVSTLYQDDDPLFMFKEVNSYFDQILLHYQNVLTLIDSKICLFGGSSIQSSTSGIDALASSLNFQFQHLTLVFISYCQGILLFHQDNALFVNKITGFINQFVNTDLLCIKISDPEVILIDISAYLPVLNRIDTQELLNSYMNLLNGFGLINPTISHSVFQCTILTLHSLNDLILRFLNDLTILFLEVSSIVPICL